MAPETAAHTLSWLLCAARRARARARSGGAGLTLPPLGSACCCWRAARRAARGVQQRPPAPPPAPAPTPPIPCTRGRSYCVATHPAAETRLLAELAAAGLPCGRGLEAAFAVVEGWGPDGLGARVSRCCAHACGGRALTSGDSGRASPALAAAPTTALWPSPARRTKLPTLLPPRLPRPCPMHPSAPALPGRRPERGDAHVPSRREREPQVSGVGGSGRGAGRLRARKGGRGRCACNQRARARAPGEGGRM